MNKKVDENVLITLDKLDVPFEVCDATSNMGGCILFVVTEFPESEEVEETKLMFGYEFDVSQYDGLYFLEKELTPDEISYFKTIKNRFVTTHSNNYGAVFKRIGKESLKDRMKQRRKGIKKKLYLCNVKGCSWKGAMLSKGMCPYHYSLMYSEQRKKNKLNTKSSSDEFFDKHIKILKTRPYSDYKMTPINRPSRVNICHILPKRETNGFPSMGEVDDNILYLTWQQHHNFDKWLDNREYDKLKKEMPEIYDILLERLPKLLEEAEERNKFYFDLKKLIEDEQDIS